MKNIFKYSPGFLAGVILSSAFAGAAAANSNLITNTIDELWVFVAGDPVLASQVNENFEYLESKIDEEVSFLSDDVIANTVSILNNEDGVGVNQSAISQVDSSLSSFQSSQSVRDGGQDVLIDSNNSEIIANQTEINIHDARITNLEGGTGECDGCEVASGTFDTAVSTTIVSATSQAIFITEVACGGSWDASKRLYVRRLATGSTVLVATGMGTQETNYQLNGPYIAKIGPSVIKFSVNTALVLEPGDSLELTSTAGSQGYWSGYIDSGGTGECDACGAASGIFDTAASTTIVSATSHAIFITEVACGGSWDASKRLYVRRLATGSRVLVATGMGTQETNYQLNGPHIAKIGPSVIKFSANPALILEPGDSLELESNVSSQGYWCGYLGP